MLIILRKHGVSWGMLGVVLSHLVSYKNVAYLYAWFLVVLSHVVSSLAIFIS